MLKSDFLREMEDILDVESGSLTEEQVLEDCEAWDSLAMLAFTALASEKFGREISGNLVRRVRTVADLYRLGSTGNSASV